MNQENTEERTYKTPIYQRRANQAYRQRQRTIDIDAYLEKQRAYMRQYRARKAEQEKTEQETEQEKSDASA